MIRKTALLLVVAMNLPLAAGERLTMRVSPAVAREPALLTVRATVQSDVDNRALEVVVQSTDFYRSSSIQLEGSEAPRLNVFEFRNLPSGDYDVTSTLVDSHGQRVSTSQLFRVVQSPGSGR
jgi:hypothetical protein